jgi:hypothetical protein
MANRSALGRISRCDRSQTRRLWVADVNCTLLADQNCTPSLLGSKAIARSCHVLKGDESVVTTLLGARGGQGGSGKAFWGKPQAQTIALQCLEARPDQTALEPLLEFRARYAERYTLRQLSTMQRRLQVWRREAVKRLICDGQGLTQNVAAEQW